MCRIEKKSMEGRFESLFSEKQREFRENPPQKSGTVILNTRSFLKRLLLLFHKLAATKMAKE